MKNVKKKRRYTFKTHSLRLYAMFYNELTIPRYLKLLSRFNQGQGGLALTRAVEVDQAGLGLDVVEVVLITVVTQPVSVPPTVSTRHGARVPAAPLRQPYRNIPNI